MSQELTKVKDVLPGPLALSLTDEEVKEFQEAWATNIGGDEITVANLPRIKMVGGAAPLLMAPTAAGEEPVQRVEGVVVFKKDRRAYWKSKELSNTPPDCSSNDCKQGNGTPGGKCKECPLAVFGSDTVGAGQACKEIRDLYMLRGEDSLPEILSLPPTSVKASKDFFVRLIGSRIPLHGALIAIEIKKAQNPQGKPYGKAMFSLVRSLMPIEKQRAMQFGVMCEALAERVPIQRQDSE